MSATEKSRVSLQELTELSLLCALMVGGKEAMRLLPNIHPVMILLLLAVLLYGWKAMYPVVGFVVLEILLYGLGIWNIMYIYMWPLVVAAAMPFRASRSWAFWAAFAGLFGLCFGALCSIPYLLFGGWKVAFSYWIAGIPFDLVHCVANAVQVFIVLPPLYRLARRRKAREVR